MNASVAERDAIEVMALQAVFCGNRQMRLVRTPMRRPASDEALVRLDGCGVCASNLPVWEGRDWFTYPLEPGAPGHEGWGEVVAVGADVDARELAVGDRVALLSQHAYASHDIAPASMLARIPDALGAQSFPAEPVACVMNILRRSDIRPGQWLAVVGVGFMGALLVQGARSAGARVIAITRRPWARAVAERCGADCSLDGGDAGAAIATVREVTGGAGCARVIEAAGEQATLDLASALCAEGGRLVIAGYHQDGNREVDMQQWNWRGLDVINAHERDPAVQARGLHEAMRAVAEGTLDPFALITHELELRELGRAFELMRERPDGFMKAVVKA
jgi:threonine dehydrogenase-like Zn-dependent dehydrogenase